MLDFQQLRRQLTIVLLLAAAFVLGSAGAMMVGEWSGREPSEMSEPLIRIGDYDGPPETDESPLVSAS